MVIMKQWAMTIGINQYHCFQPLRYAQRDAQALHHFLVQEAGFSPQQCLLMTETSLPMWGKSTYPSQENLQSWLELLSQSYLQPGDQLWYFFSGYGVCDRGQDYLMPIDGDPHTIQQSGIAITAVFEQLQAIPASHELVLLDISRSQGVVAKATVGTQTAQLAATTRIPTILSCQPDQFSCETSALGHGLFTAGLLEGLRSSPTVTLEKLDHYLRDRLPELSDHYWQPIQTSCMISPAALMQQPILRLPTAAIDGEMRAPLPPTHADAKGGVAASNGTVAKDGRLNTAAKNASIQSGELPAGAVQNGDAIDPRTGQLVQGRQGGQNLTRVTVSSLQNGFTHTHINRQPIGQFMGSHSPSHSNGNGANQPPLPATPPPEQSDEEVPDQLFWRPFLLWSGLTVIVLLLGVLTRNWQAFSPSIAQAPSDSSQAAPATQARSDAPPAQPQPTSNPASANAAKPQPASVQSSQSFTKPSAAVKPANSVPPAPAPLAVARTKAQSIPNQAHPLHNAILAASQIQPGQPQYQEAQQEIANWSRRIFEIAKQHAQSQDYISAIRAAAWVPRNQPIYAQVQQAIAQWCPAIKNLPLKNADQQQAIDACRQVKK